MDLGVVTKWREDVLNSLPNSHHNDFQGRLGLQSSTAKFHVISVWGRVFNLLPNLVSLRWWNGERMADEIGNGTSCWIVYLRWLSDDLVHVVVWCAVQFVRGAEASFRTEIDRLLKPQIQICSNLVCSNPRSWTTSFLGSYLVISEISLFKKVRIRTRCCFNTQKSAKETP